MKIKNFYSYCIKNIPDCHKEVGILQEIKKCSEEKPKIMINLSTLMYHFNLNRKEMLVGIQFNKRKCIIEGFFEKLTNSGAELIFVIKKTNATDEFLKKEYKHYVDGRKFMDKIKNSKDFNDLMTKKRVVHKIPYHSLIELYLIQSAEKFGQLYVFNSVDESRAIQIAHFANELNVKWILGLDSVQFLVASAHKIWSDETLDLNGMTVLEIDKDVILKHLELDVERIPFFIALGGKLESKSWVMRRVDYYFKPPKPTHKITELLRFVKSIDLPITDQTYNDIATRMFIKKMSFFAEVLRAAVKKFSVKPKEIEKPNCDEELSNLMENKFISFAEEIVLNRKPIFVSPVFMTLDTVSPEMENFYTIILPVIQKTAGVLLKNSDDKDSRELVMLSKDEKKFHRYLITPIYPDFDVPSLKTLLSGDYPNFDKKKIACWIMNVELDEIDPSLSDDLFVDFLILTNLCKKRFISSFGAVCLLRTIIDSKVISQKNSEYPEKVYSNGLHYAFLYTNMYIIVHSCLDSLGMKDFRPELKFDGAYFQKMYSLLYLDEQSEIDADVSELIDLLGRLI